jgi:transcriptional regulator of acetoin/glycerol metabolism
MAMEGHDYISRDTLIQFIEVTTDANDVHSRNASDQGEYPFNTVLDKFEADLLKGLLKKHSGNVENAAREANMNMATIYRKIKKYNIRREEFC